MSTLTQFLGGGVKSIQTGYISTSSISSGSGEDVRFVNVTISSVDTAKSLVRFDGGFGDTVLNAMAKSGSTWDSLGCTARLTSGTNLRISVQRGVSEMFVGRWTVVEYY